MMELDRISATLLLVVCGSSIVAASVGDRSLVFVRCLNDCRQKNCSMSVEEFALTQPLHMRMLDWTCIDECRYMCMWKTVDAFERDHQPIPQFYGKWPFVRLFGIQEPASTLFSVLNGLSHVVMLQYFTSKVGPKTPMYYIWFFYSLLAMNAWTWSTVFHTRDTDTTEKMDYFCATLLVMYSLFALITRLSYDLCKWLSPLGGVSLLAFYIYHVYHLGFVEFSYSYNLLVCVCVGIIHTIGWVAWSWWTYKRTGRTYVWRIGACSIGVSMLSLLEVGDFAPLGWILDAHALWHATTIPVAFIWYRFAVDDCLYLRSHLQRTSKPNGINAAESLSSVTVSSESKKTS